MNPIRILAIALVIAGVLGIAYGGFSYTSETHRADIGPMHLQVNEQKRVNIPLWAGVLCIAGGAALLMRGRS